MRRTDHSTEACAVSRRGWVARVARGALVLALFAPIAAAAETTELKLSFFASEQSDTYRYGVKPFVDAVNAEAEGLVHIKVYPDGALGKRLAEQPEMVLDGHADIAFVVPGQTPYRFPDNALIEQPGLFRDAREGTLVYTHLLQTHALRGYGRFFVIGAYTPHSNYLHCRKPIASLAALHGQKIRANNPMEAEALDRLGAMPTVMPVSRLAKAIREGAIDCALLSPTGLMQFGVARLTGYHYLLGFGSAPLALLMSRKKFDSLPEPARRLIRKYSGDWTASVWIDGFGAAERSFLAKLKSETDNSVVEPSPADRETARRVYRSLIDNWAARSPHNRALLRLVGAELSSIRSGD